MTASATAAPAKMRERPIDCMDVFLPTCVLWSRDRQLRSVYQRPKNTDSIEIDTPFGR